MQLIRKNLEAFTTNQTFTDTTELIPNYRWDQFFSKDYFIVYSQQVTREKVMNDLLNRMAVQEVANYPQLMLEKISHREQMGQIVFSDTIAVPHPSTPVGKISKIGLAIIPNGLYWDEKYQAIRFVFLISPSIYENEALPTATKCIVELIDRQKIQKNLLRVNTFEEMLTTLEKVSDKGSAKNV